MPLTIAERFWSKVKVGQPDECWPWLATKDNHGYGHFWANGRTIKAHRFASELSTGPIPSGLFCCHTCDNRACCNPAHLFNGTARDNIRDCMKKGRFNPQPSMLFGEAVGNARLNLFQVLEIKRQLDQGEQHKSIAATFKISLTHVANIKSGRNWSRAIAEYQDATP